MERSANASERFLTPEQEQALVEWLEILLRVTERAKEDEDHGR